MTLASRTSAPAAGTAGPAGPRPGFAVANAIAIAITSIIRRGAAVT